MSTAEHVHPSSKSWDVNRYESGRQSYPTESIAILTQNLELSQSSPTGQHKVIVDLGAGTGKLTRLLGDFLEPGSKIVAVEPVREMREKLIEICANKYGDGGVVTLEVLEGSGERIPLPDQSASAVVAGQSFHWFANETALREIHRVLVPGGHLGLIWNTYDESPALAETTELIQSYYVSNEPRYRTLEWKRVFENQTLFSPLQEQRVETGEQGVPMQVMLDRILSLSAIGLRTEEEKVEIVAKLKATWSDKQGVIDENKVYQLSHKTMVYWTKKL